RYVATSILADYAADKPKLLAELIKDSDFQQYAELIVLLQNPNYHQQAVDVMKEELAKTPPSDGKPEERDRIAKRRGECSGTLFRLGKFEPVWPVFQHSPDPSTRSYLIHYLKPLGAGVEPLVQRWLGNQEQDKSAQRALILSLGEFDSALLAVRDRQAILDK